jgi:hypothetical protein
MRVPRPSPALVVAFLALLLALGGVAFAATGSAVNIVDPSDPSLAAKVDKTGKLEVGDGGVPLTVDGTITTKATTPPGAWSASAFVGVGLEEKLLAQPTPGAIDITAIHVSAPYNISSSSSYTRACRAATATLTASRSRQSTSRTSFLASLTRMQRSPRQSRYAHRPGGWSAWAPWCRWDPPTASW